MLQNQKVIEAREVFGNRRKRAKAKSKPAVLQTHVPEIETLCQELEQVKSELRLLKAREENLKDQIADHYQNIKVENIKKGRRINRLEHVDAGGTVKVEVQDKNQFREIMIEQYEPLLPLIGHVLYEAFIEEIWLAKPCEEFDPGKLTEAIVIGIYRLLQGYDIEPSIADHVAEYTWNILQNWFIFDTKLKVKNQDFSHRFELLRHKVSDEQLENWMAFEEFARYRAAVVVR